MNKPVSLMVVAAATVLLLGPAANHRHGVRLTLAGMTLLALSICRAVFVVGRIIFDDTRVGAGLAAAMAVVTAVIWCVGHDMRRSRSDTSPERPSATVRQHLL